VISRPKRSSNGIGQTGGFQHEALEFGEDRTLPVGAAVGQVAALLSQDDTGLGQHSQLALHRALTAARGSDDLALVECFIGPPKKQGQDVSSDLGQKCVNHAAPPFWGQLPSLLGADVKPNPPPAAASQ